MIGQSLDGKAPGVPVPMPIQPGKPAAPAPPRQCLPWFPECHPYGPWAISITIAPNIAGPLNPNDTVDYWSNGKHIEGTWEEDGTLTVNVTYVTGVMLVFGGPALWDGCNYQVLSTSWTTTTGETYTVTRGDGGVVEEVRAARSGDVWAASQTDEAHPKRTTEIKDPDETVVRMVFDDEGDSEHNTGRLTQVLHLSDDPQDPSTLSEIHYGYDYYDPGNPPTYVSTDPERLRSVTSDTKTTVYDYYDDLEDNASRIIVREVYRAQDWPATADDVYSETWYDYAAPVDDLATTTITRKALGQTGVVDDETIYEYYCGTDDAKDYKIKSITRNGETTSYTYTAGGQVETVTDPKERVVTYEYADNSDQWEPVVTSATLEDASENTLAELSYTYYQDDGYNRWLKTQKDVRGNYTYYERADTNHMDRVTGIKVATGPDEPANWAAEPYVESYTCYGDSDTHGRAGQLATVTVPNVDGDDHACVTTLYYDETVDSQAMFFDTPTEVYRTNTSGSSVRVATYTHDVMGNVLSATDADDKTTWFTYDLLGNPIRTIYAKDGETPTIYTENHYMSCCGLLDSVRNENGDRLYFDYDKMKRPNRVWTDIQAREWGQVDIDEGTGEVTNGLAYDGTPAVTCEYDKLGRIYSATFYPDASSGGITTSCTYDANSRVTDIDYPGDIADTDYDYDEVGNLLYAKGGPENTYFTAKYHLLDRVTDIYLTGLGTLPNPLPSGTGDIRIAYDGSSYLVTDVYRDSKHVTYSYDTFGRLKTYKPTTGPISGVSLWYDYNSLGQKKEVTIKDGVGATVHSTTYDYYRNGWLKSINYDGSKVAEYTHDAVGLLAQIDFYHDDPVLGNIATGAYDVYSYDTTDPRNFLKTITMHYKDAGGNPASSVVDYTDGNGNPNVDKAGNQLSMGNLAGQWTYTYDHAGRISSIVPPNPVPEQGLGGDYGYNWLGQLTNPPADPNHLTYNSAGLLSTWPGMYSYAYKASGWPEQVKNPASTTTIASLTYDSAGYLTGTTFEGVTAQYSWDADGTPLGYTETAGGSETGSGLTNRTASVPCEQVEDISGDVVYYICDPQGATIASVSSAGVVHYHADGAGRIVMSTKSDGKVQGTYIHGPDGRIASTNDPQGAKRLRGKTGSHPKRPPGAGPGSPDMSAVLRAFNQLKPGSKTYWNYNGDDGWTRDIAAASVLRGFRSRVYKLAGAGYKGRVKPGEDIGPCAHFCAMLEGNPEDVIDLGSFHVDARIDGDNIYFTAKNTWSNNSKYGLNDFRRLFPQLPTLPDDHWVYMKWEWVEHPSRNWGGRYGYSPQGPATWWPWWPGNLIRGIVEDPILGPIVGPPDFGKPWPPKDAVWPGTPYPGMPIPWPVDPHHPTFP